MESNITRSSIAEFIGTFMLVLVGAGAVTILSRANPAVAADVVVAALAHGLIIAAIVFTFGHVSGAHVNPAVTLGLLVGGHVSIVKAVAYWIAQFAGGIAAALVLRFVFAAEITNLGQTVPNPTFALDSIRIIVVEGLLTFFLVSTVYQAAVYGKAGNVAGLAIGFTLAACILFGGPLTGASLNPARTLGPGLITGDTTEIIAYLIGIFGGGASAGALHSFFFDTRSK